MSKIKNIYSFGTSFSNAGGFEFHRKPHMVDFYKPLGIELDKTKVQYLYLLSKLLDNKMKCINFAKDGFGNERVYRKIYDITMGNGFKPEENLFIIEFSDLGRKEFFVNKDNRYGIINYNVKGERDVEFRGSSYDYTKEIYSQNLYEVENLFKLLFRETFDFKEEVDKVHSSIYKTISYLELLKIPYILLEAPSHLYDRNQITLLINEIYKKRLLTIKGDTIFKYLRGNGYTIKHETNGLVDDLHFGYHANVIFSKMVYNKMIELKLILDTPYPLDDILSNSYI
jgi:hypothetical protein